MNESNKKWARNKHIEDEFKNLVKKENELKIPELRAKRWWKTNS